MTHVADADVWADRAKNLLKAELKRRGLGYDELAERLGELGIDDNARNIANKLARGGFSAVFLLQCLTAIGVKTLNIEP